MIRSLHYLLKHGRKVVCFTFEPDSGRGVQAKPFLMMELYHVKATFELGWNKRLNCFSKWNEVNFKSELFGVAWWWQVISLWYLNIQNRKQTLDLALSSFLFNNCDWDSARFFVAIFHTCQISFMIVQHLKRRFSTYAEKFFRQEIWRELWDRGLEIAWKW